MFTVRNQWESVAVMWHAAFLQDISYPSKSQEIFRGVIGTSAFEYTVLCWRQNPVPELGTCTAEVIKKLTDL